MPHSARKAAIVSRKAEPVSEMASEIGDGLHAIAEGLHAVAGVLSWAAAAQHSEDHGRQRQMAAVIYRTSCLRFEKVKSGGEYVAQADLEACDKLWKSFFKAKR